MQQFSNALLQIQDAYEKLLYAKYREDIASMMKEFERVLRHENKGHSVRPEGASLDQFLESWVQYAAMERADARELSPQHANIVARVLIEVHNDKKARDDQIIERLQAYDEAQKEWQRYYEERDKTGNEQGIDKYKALEGKWLALRREQMPEGDQSRWCQYMGYDDDEAERIRVKKEYRAKRKAKSKAKSKSKNHQLRESIAKGEEGTATVDECRHNVPWLAVKNKDGLPCAHCNREVGKRQDLYVCVGCRLSLCNMCKKTAREVEREAHKNESGEMDEDN